MKKNLIWLLAALVCSTSADLPAQTLPAETLTVEQVVRDVVRNNDRVKAAAFMEEAARRQIGPAGAWDDPMLMLGVQNVPPSFRFDEDMMTMKMVGLSQKIPYAGEKGLQKQAKTAEADAVGEDRREIIIELVAAAKTAYTELYYHQQLIDDLKRQRSLYEQVVSSTRSRVESNRADLDELAAAQAALWRTDAELLSHHNDAHSAHLRIDALRGITHSMEMPAVAPPAPSPLPDSAEAWAKQSRRNYPPLQRLQRQAESYRYSCRAANRMSWPMLELGANYGIREDVRLNGETMPQDNMWSFQATFSIPIFSGRQQRNMAKSMEAMQKQAESEASQLDRDVAGTLQTLHQRARRLDESRRLYRQQILSADEQAFQSALSGYSAGRASLPDLLEYALAIYRDRTMASQLELAYAKTMIEAERYTSDADEFAATNKPRQ